MVRKLLPLKADDEEGGDYWDEEGGDEDEEGGDGEDTFDENEGA